MTHPTFKGTRIVVNPSYLTERLRELGWDWLQIQQVYDRLIAIAEADEDYVEVSRRLNPGKPKQPAWTPEKWQARERELRASPGLDLELSARVRDARARQRA